MQDPLLKLHLFDAVVRPSLLYGVEVRGPNSLGRKVSAPRGVYNEFLQCTLGVRATSSLAVIMGELGCYSLEIVAWPQLARFWNRLVDMGDDRLVKQAFTESVRLAGLNTRAPWAAHMAAAMGVDLLTEGPALVTVAGGVAAAREAYLATLGGRTSPSKPS